MTRFKTTLAGFGLAIGLLALPLGAGAETAGGLQNSYSSHRFFFAEEEAGRTQGAQVARYAMVELTELEKIAGRQYLDTETIQFLEDNLWERETVARGAGGADELTELERIAGRQNLDTATIKFLEDNIWEQQTVARIAGLEPPPLTDEELSILGDDSGAATAGRSDNPGAGVNGIDPGFYPYELPWQDLVDPMAGFAESENTGTGVYAIDPDMFSDEIAWQDRVVEGVATPQAVPTPGIFPMPYDAPQLRSEDFLNY